MSAASEWDASWEQYPKAHGKAEALARIQASILGRPQPTDTKAPTPIQAGPPAVQDGTDRDTQPEPEDFLQTLTLPGPIGQETQPVQDNRGKWVKPAAITCAALLTIGAGTGAASLVRSALANRAYANAVAACEQAGRDGRTAFGRPYATTYKTALSIRADQVKDPKTVTRLHDLVDKAAPAPNLTGGCTTGADRNDLNDRTARMNHATEERNTLNQRISTAAKAVLASRDAKILEDAKSTLAGKKDEAARLLGDSDGKVADNATRDALQKAIDQAGGVKGGKAKDYQDAASALQSAVDQVNASMQAKAQADQQAADQAAQQQAAAQQQPAPQQPAPSYGGGGGYTPTYRPPANHGGGGQSAPAPAPPQGGWSVPPAGGNGNAVLPDHL